MEEAPEPFPDSNAFYRVVTRQGNEWWEGACRVLSGCASMPTACEPVRWCLFEGAFTSPDFVVDDQAAWVKGRRLMVPRPFGEAGSQIGRFIPSLGFPAGKSIVQLGGQAAGIPSRDGVFIPRRAVTCARCSPDEKV